jgi:hypothetical protein
LSKKEIFDKADKFISDKTYNKVSDHVSAKHPGHKLHGLGRGPNGTINWRAYHKDDNNFKKPISGVFKESVELDERMMTDAEMKKREDIVKGMKKGLAEVSSNTLKRYKKAAQRDIDTTDNAGLYTDSDIDRMGRRMKGIDQATSKINANKRKEQGVAEGWTKLPSGDYQNSHTGVRTSKPPVKKKRGEKTGAEWDAIEKAKKEQGVAEGSDFDSAAFDRHMDKLRAQKELEKTDPMRAMVNKMKSDHDYTEKSKSKSKQDDKRQITDPFHPSQGVNIGEQSVAGFKERYGDRAKNVMYATANKNAMKD